MSVKKDSTGRRSISVEIEVPGTPEQVWRAIATGPGISSWFYPTEIDGDTMTLHWAPGMDSTSTVKTWEPLHRFVAESQGLGPNAPPMATEWIVEARGGGTCVVRVVHSLFASTDDWDAQLEGMEEGWPAFFEVLRIYLAHHFGEPSASVLVMSAAGGSPSEAWAALAGPLGLADATPGGRTGPRAPGVPPFAGVVERATRMEQGQGLVLRLDEPAPGVALLGAQVCGGLMASVSLYLFGAGAAAAAKRDEPAWRAWMNQRFPQPAAPAGHQG
jgi:uncharacterized protein YndB with AHSA1/START domain